MTCRESANLLSLFLDGELDPHQMRAVALHSARCPACEQDLRHLEHLQELVNAAINGAVDAINFESFWPGIERQLAAARQPWLQRLRSWWVDGAHGWAMRLPAFAAAAAIAAFALFLFTHSKQPTPEPAAFRVAAVDNTTSIESLDTDVDSVAVLNDPETRTTVLWVSDTQNGDVP